MYNFSVVFDSFNDQADLLYLIGIFKYYLVEKNNIIVKEISKISQVNIVSIRVRDLGIDLLVYLVLNIIFLNYRHLLALENQLQKNVFYKI